jgi:hypothetical protein
MFKLNHYITDEYLTDARLDMIEKASFKCKCSQEIKKN